MLLLISTEDRHEACHTIFVVKKYPVDFTVSKTVSNVLLFFFFSFNQ